MKILLWNTPLSSKPGGFPGRVQFVMYDVKKSMTSLLPSNYPYERFFSWLSHALSKGFCFSMTTFHGRSVWPLRIPSQKTKLLSQYLAWKLRTSTLIIPSAHYWVTFIVSLPTRSNIMVTNSIYHATVLRKKQ